MTAATSFLAGLLGAGLLGYAMIGDPSPAMPDPGLTPGAVASRSLAEVCAEDGRPGSAYSRAHRHTSPEMRAEVLRRYRLVGHFGGEIDHRVPLCLGGADTLDNLWPQADYQAKDALEAYACRAVCRMAAPLGEAQAWFLGDWTQQLWRVGR